MTSHPGVAFVVQEPWYPGAMLWILLFILLILAVGVGAAAKLLIWALILWLAVAILATAASRR